MSVAVGKDQNVNIVFPHQLFEHSPLFEKDGIFLLVESDLYFNQFEFHRAKLVFQRASMRFYKSYLEEKGIEVVYVDCEEEVSEIRKLVAYLSERETKSIRYIDPADDWLETRIVESAEDAGIEVECIESPQFLNTRRDLEGFFRKEKKKFYQTSFYKSERERLGILLNPDGTPKGGKWTFDTENRKPYPKDKKPPEYKKPSAGKFLEPAIVFAEKKSGLGEANKILFPVTHEDAKKHLLAFLKERFTEFGDFEDAIVRDQTVLNHSLLSPLINSGLLTAEQVIDASISFASDHDIPINSLEGFVRQVIGWREFIRGVYTCKGRYQRTRNYWGFEREIPDSFYDGTTGIEPFDITIRKVLKTGYCHHIERLMILGNFMLLCEIRPDDVYRWFMEMFVDAYDWVMVPNVYGMSQFADGGLMTTKPYISGSNYILKMSDYETGEWCGTWDGLFWNFIDKRQDFFKGNPRMRMLVSNWNRMKGETRGGHLDAAEKFLQTL